MRNYMHRFKSGMSLMEVVVSLVIFAIAAFIILNLITYSARMSVQVQKRTVATAIAEGIMEATKANIITANDFNVLMSTGFQPVQASSEFIYDIDVASVSQSVKYLGVSVYYRNKKNANPQPDKSHGTSGRILKLGTYVITP